MPPPLPTESDAESAADPEIGKKADAAEAPVEEEMKDATDNPAEEEEEEDNEDDEGEVYVVEKILSHHDKFDDVGRSVYGRIKPGAKEITQGVMRYEIKWKGYEKKSDRTWETEDNLAGAREILEAYWASIGGKPEPTPKPPKSTGKKRGRQSTGSQIGPGKKQKRGRKSTSAIPDPDATPEPPVGYTDVDPDTWRPPTPNDNAWDPLLQQVDTIQKDSNDEVWAYLVWNEKNADGRYNRSKARLSTCRKACPQKMLTFYEQHVDSRTRVFTNNKKDYVEENGATATQ
ncbi:MAG: hypothetical protein L6R39_006527 [Caloplaca ligustica]|nr:MAG: hypothetical protein L6R39_006527 [Caloplaca ligustica]